MTNEERGVIIQRMKGFPGGQGVRLPIRDESLCVIGYLRAFDESLLRDGDLIKTMADTHTRYKEFFLTQFDVTPENKQRWLEESVLKNSRKILFLVETADGRVVGQDGFTLDEEEGSAILDGAMRWARGGRGNLFARSGVERTAICFSLLECRVVRSEIFEDNEFPLLSTESTQDRVSPLHVSRQNGKTLYVKVAPGLENTDKKLVCLSITRDAFAERHGNILQNPSWSEYFPP